MRMEQVTTVPKWDKKKRKFNLICINIEHNRIKISTWAHCYQRIMLLEVLSQQLLQQLQSKTKSTTKKRYLHFCESTGICSALKNTNIEFGLEM